jgi:colanic acid/amylovoran biosynthesis glycosyltransferase
MKNVCHMLVKDSDLHSSFIINQIKFHKEFTPSIASIYSILHPAEQFDKSEIACFHLYSRRNYLMNNLLRNRINISAYSLKYLSMFLKDNNIDILHFHYGMSAWRYHRLLKTISLPSVVSFYGYDCHVFPFKHSNYGMLQLQKYVFPLATKILAMSQAMKNDLLLLGCPEDKIIIHYHGIPINIFQVERTNYNNQPTRLTMISRLSPGKGHLFALKALQEAVKTNPDIRLNIYGSGMCLKDIERYIKSNAMNYVALLGSLKYASEAHLKALQDTDIFLHPSITGPNGSKEGIPGSLIEAMASGLPVITTAIGGIPSVVFNMLNGIVVDEYDIKGLTDAILTLADNSVLRKELGSAAAEFVKRNYDISDQEKKLETIYHSLL